MIRYHRLKPTNLAMNRIPRHTTTTANAFCTNLATRTYLFPMAPLISPVAAQNGMIAAPCPKPNASIISPPVHMEMSCVTSRIITGRVNERAHGAHPTEKRTPRSTPAKSGDLWLRDWMRPRVLPLVSGTPHASLDCLAPNEDRPCLTHVVIGNNMFAPIVISIAPAIKKKVVDICTKSPM